jgi:predicted membrane metal-binding protein
MAGSETWAGWIRLGAILILIISMLDFFEGLIAIIRGDYYAVRPDQIVVFDLSTWGWLTLLWSIALAVIGFALLAGATWSRWAGIVVCSVNFFGQLGFVGSSQYPLWALTVLVLNVIVLYALVVKWDEGAETIRRMAETRI